MKIQNPAGGFPTGNLDSEYGGVVNSSALRRGFIRKVFSILTVQLAITFGFVAMCYFFTEVNYYVVRHPGLYYVSYFTFLVTYILLVCCKDIARKTPWNYICLGTLTMCMAYMLAMMTAFHRTESVMAAVAITMAVCVGIILFSFQTKYDFTSWIGPAFAASIAFLFFGLFAIIFYSRVMQMIYGAIGAILFSIFLAMDTQMIVGGKRYEMSEEDYIFGALMLYLDIAYIFIYVLSFFGARD